MDKQVILITKEKTAIIKGIAILFMIAHHCLIKEFYVNQPETLKSVYAVHFYIGMKMCVGLFTFIVGYGFFYAKNGGVRYIFNHVWRLIKQYWTVLFISLLLAFRGGIALIYSVLY